MKPEGGVKTFNKSVKVKSRRARVISRLEQQLLKGMKIESKTKNTVLLSDKDITRINKELETLKSRV